MNTKYSNLVMLAVFVSFNVVAGETLTVLGLPIGGVLKVQPAPCPDKESDAKDICWISKPYVAKDGTRLGMVRLPNPDARPSWAEFALFRITVSKRGSLEALEVRTHDARLKHDIAHSISSRFGLPNESTLANRKIASATWIHQDVHIHQLCNDSDICNVEFRSSKYQAAVEQELADRRRKAAARPVAP